MINCNMRIQVDGGGKSSDYKWMGVEKVINCKLAAVFIYTQHAKLAETCMHAAAGPGTRYEHCTCLWPFWIGASTSANEDPVGDVSYTVPRSSHLYMRNCTVQHTYKL